MSEITHKWTGNDIPFVNSEKGSLHCFQACFVMAVSALKGTSVSMEEAEKLTGFVDGVETWPHQGFLAFSRFGIHVNSIEKMNPEGFANDPVKEINKMFPDKEIADYIFEITDLNKEQELVRKCLEDSKISFENRVPQIEDVIKTISNGGLVIATLDYGVLHNTGDYEGHSTLIKGIGEKEALIVDPGPPGQDNWIIATNKLEQAIHSPTHESGQLLQLY